MYKRGSTMYLFKIDSNQFGISYFFPGIFQKKNGFISLYESRSMFRVLSIFLLIDCLFIGLLLYSTNGINRISILSILLMQFFAFFLRNYFLSKSKIRTSVINLSDFSVAPMFYWIAHFLMAFSIVYALYCIGYSHQISPINSSLEFILNILQITFCFILMSPFINLIFTKIKAVSKWI